MYRRRPPVHDGQVNLPSVLREGVHGFCYLAPQNALYFGSTRRHPTEWRPVVSGLADQGRRYVFPATTMQNRDFYHLRPDRCFLKRQGKLQSDSWLCPRMEVIDVGELIELGVLPHEEALRIVAWLRQREQVRT